MSYKTTVPNVLVLQDNADNSAAIEQYAGWAATTRLTGRTLYTDGSWNTICLPFDMKDEDLYWFDSVKRLDSTEFDEATGSLKLNFKDAEEIEAGKPYLVRWELDDDEREYYSQYQSSFVTFDNDANITYYEFEPAVIKNTLHATVTEYADFIGSFSPVSLTEGDRTMLYLGSDNTLYYPSTDVTINSCRAYFKLKGLTAGDLAGLVNRIMLNFSDEETTGIENVNGNVNYNYNDNSDGGWTTISGLRLDRKPTAKGLYIHHGRKVVIH